MVNRHHSSNNENVGSQKAVCAQLKGIMGCEIQSIDV